MNAQSAVEAIELHKFMLETVSRVLASASYESSREMTTLKRAMEIKTLWLAEERSLEAAERAAMQAEAVGWVRIRGRSDSLRQAMAWACQLSNPLEAAAQTAQICQDYNVAWPSLSVAQWGSVYAKQLSQEALVRGRNEEKARQAATLERLNISTATIAVLWQRVAELEAASPKALFVPQAPKSAT